MGARQKIDELKKKKQGQENNVAKADLRVFCAIWAGIFGVFFVIGLWGGSVRIWAILGAIFSVALMWLPSVASVIYRAQVGIGGAISFVISRGCLLLLFTCVFIPISLIFRIFSRDVLRQKRQKVDSYFIAREKQPGSMRNQF